MVKNLFKRHLTASCVLRSIVTLSLSQILRTIGDNDANLFFYGNDVAAR